MPVLDLYPWSTALALSTVALGLGRKRNDSTLSLFGDRSPELGSTDIQATECRVIQPTTREN